MFTRKSHFILSDSRFFMTNSDFSTCLINSFATAPKSWVPIVCPFSASASTISRSSAKLFREPLRFSVFLYFVAGPSRSLSVVTVVVELKDVVVPCLHPYLCRQRLKIAMDTIFAYAYDPVLSDRTTLGWTAFERFYIILSFGSADLFHYPP